MSYIPKEFEKQTTNMRRAVEWGTGLIAGLAGVGLFKSEVQRIMSLPSDPVNYLYLSLLSTTVLLAAGWIIVAYKELGIVCEWLDPKEYKPPDETITILSIAVALVGLLFTARDALWFGFAYSIYSAVNLAASIHLRNEYQTAIRRSRQRLESEPPSNASIYLGALVLLNVFYVRRPNIRRVIVMLFLGLTGLGCSLIGVVGHHKNLISDAYIIYLFSILILEGAVAYFWRAKLYNGLRPLDVAKYESERSQMPNETKED